MDLDLIRQRLNNLENKSTKETTDYSKVLWTPELGDHVIRIIPSKYTPSNPFSELRFHYNIARFPMMALTNFNQQDPIVDFVQKLYDEGDEESVALARKITPRSRIYAPVVVRGEEDKGVRLYGFGVTVYKELMRLAADEDIGDYTDVNNGFDIKITVSKGSQFNETSVNIKPTRKPATKDPDQLQEWLDEQPNPLEVFPKYDYQFIKNKLQAYLTPSAEQEEQEEEQPQSKPEPPAPRKKSAAADKFRTVFKDGMSNG